MEVDIKTLILILAITHLLQIFVFIYQYLINPNIKGPGWWIAWSVTETIGFSLIILRTIPELLPAIILIQNIVLLAGTIMIYIGVLKFFGQKLNYKLIASLFFTFILIHLFFIYYENSITIRSINISFFIAIFSFTTAYSILKSKTKSINLTANFNAGIFIVHGLVFVYRGAAIIFGQSVTEVFEPSFFTLLPYADSLIASLLWTFGFIMMLNQKLNTETTEAKQHFELIFRTSPDAVAITNIETGLIIDCNDVFVKSSGFDKDDLLGNTTIGLNIWSDFKERDLLIKQVQKTGSCENMEATYIHKNGKKFTGLVSAKTISFLDKKLLLSVTRDITERKLIEEEVREINHELKKLNSEKDKFFSIIAHDLRNPFGSFLSLTEFLVDQIDEMPIEELKVIISEMKTSSLNLYSLLENLLEWSGMEQGMMPFKPVRIKLQELLKDSLPMLHADAERKSINLKFNVPEDFEIVVDVNMFQSIVRNIVSNSIKFTPKEGVVTFNSKYTDDEQVLITVIDSGIGMSQYMVDNLFNINVKTNRSGTENERSTGLGLILCKQFVEKHNGKIEIQSEIGQGTVISIFIPKN